MKNLYARSRMRITRSVIICLATSVTLLLVSLALLQPATASRAAFVTTEIKGPYLLKSDVIHFSRMFDELNRQSVAFDSQGYPHVVYGKDALYHAWYNGSQWQVETLDSNTGWEDTLASIAIRGSEIHVAYVKDAYLYYAHWNGTQWQTERLEAGRHGAYPSIAIEPQPPYTVHIAYSSINRSSEPQEFAVRHIWHDSTDWRSEAIDNTADARDIMLKIAATMPYTLNVVYIDEFTSGTALLKYAGHDAQGWHLEVLASGCCQDDDNHIAFTLMPTVPYTPYVAYTDYPDRNVYLMQRTQAGWQSIPIQDPIGRVYGLRGIEFEPIAPYTMHVVYDNNAYFSGSGVEPLIRHSWGNGQSWQFETIEQSPDKDGVLALEPTSPYTPNLVHLGNAELLFARRSTLTWSDTLVDQRGPAGSFNSLAIAPTAPFTPHVAYVYHGDLYHAWRSGASWLSQTIDAVGPLESVGKYGRHVSLVLAPTAPFTPTVSYYDAGYDRLMYAYFNGLSWLTSTVAISGWSPSLALEPTAPFTPHISYIDRGTSYLTHAWLSGSNWLTETVDGSAQASNKSTAIAIAAGEPYTLHIAYFDQEHGTVNYARQVTTGWVTQTVDHSPFNNHDGSAKIALALEPIAPYTPHISYLWALRPYVIAFDYSPMHAQLTAAGWQTETTLIPFVYISAGCDLAFAIEPHAPYRLYLEVVNASYQSLAYKQNGQWQTQQWHLITYGNDPQYSSLALAPTSPTVPYLTYVSSKAGDLTIWSGTEPSHFAYLPLIFRGSP